jgi:OFA family oxalate/formate antiporter-like MFS transporter
VNPQRKQAADAAIERRQAKRLLLAMAVLMVALGLFHAWSVFVVPLEERLDLSRTAVSGVYSVATVSFTLAMLLGHRLTWRLPPAALATAAALVAAAGLAMAASGSVAGLWIGYGGLFGVANGVGYGFALQTMVVALPERRGAAVSFVVTAYALGSALLAPLLELGIRSIGVLATLGVAAAFTVAAGAVQVPLLAGLEIERGVSARESAGPSTRSRTFWVLWCGFLLGAAAGLVALAHAAALVQDLEGSPSAAAAGVTLIAAGNALGRLAGGWLADLVDPRLLLVAAGVAEGVALLVSAAVPAVPVALAALTIVGLGYGAMSSLYPVATGQLFGARNLARVYGRVFTAWGIAGLFAPLLAAALFDLTGGYRISLVLAGGAALGAAAVALLLPRRLRSSPCPGGGGTRRPTRSRSPRRSPRAR